MATTTTSRSHGRGGPTNRETYHWTQCVDQLENLWTSKLDELRNFWITETDVHQNHEVIRYCLVICLCSGNSSNIRWSKSYVYPFMLKEVPQFVHSSTPPFRHFVLSSKRSGIGETFPNFIQQFRQTIAAIFRGMVVGFPLIFRRNSVLRWYL